jgi:type VI secretion system protein ImpC
MPSAPSFGSLESTAPAPEAPGPETPFRIAILGDFSGRASRGEFAADELAERKAKPVDHDNLDNVLANLGAEVKFGKVPGSKKAVTVEVGSLDDLHPDQLFEKVDHLSDPDDRDERTEAMRGVLCHEHFRSLESAWRGLDWLMRRALKQDSNIEIVLYDVAQKEVADAVNADDDLTKTPIYDLLIEKGMRGPKGKPWALIVGLYQFAPTADDAQVLGRMARIAREAAAPFVAGASPRVLDKSFALAEADAPAWEAIRKLPEAQMVGLAAPRFLLRAPYGADTKPIDRFEFEEVEKPGKPEGYLWGNAALACAALMAQGFLKEGWAFRPETSLDLGGMPMHTYTDEDGDSQAILAEAWLERKTSEKLGALGLMPLLCVRGRDAVQLAGFSSLGAAEKGKAPPPLLGKWGQKGAVQLPRSGGPATVKMGISAAPGGVAKAGKEKAPAKEAPAAEEPAEAAASGGDADLDALMKDLEGSTGGSTPSEEAAASGDADLDALMKELEGGGGSSASEPAAEGGDADLDALMKELESGTGGSSTSEPAEGGDPDLDALLKELEGK